MKNIALASMLLLFLSSSLSCSDDEKKPPPPATDSAPAAWRSAVGAGGAFTQTFDDVRWATRNVVSSGT